MYASQNQSYWYSMNYVQNEKKSGARRYFAQQCSSPMGLLNKIYTLD